ncbi:MAG TPA: 50S ribosomal protein L13 [Dehalococcoidia bacterium]|nr:50S ribosomal protein L13 [Dehalococcoidia bacterium]
MKTYSAKASEIRRERHVIDAEDKILGRLATEVARLLMGKHKPMFSRNLDVGDFVVVINAAKVRVTGNKAKQKFYYRHSGYPGGFKSISYEKLMQTKPTRVVEHAVKGMVPHNRLGASMMKKLKVYAGASQPRPAKAQAKAEAEVKAVTNPERE